MEPHTRPCSTQIGTLRLSQALLLLLPTVIAGPSSARVTQTDSGVVRWQNIKNSAYRLLNLLNPFEACGDKTTAIIVGMVKATALCGIGSALWLWTHRKKKGDHVGQQPPDPSLGKISQNISTSGSTNSPKSRALTDAPFHLLPLLTVDR